MITEDEAIAYKQAILSNADKEPVGVFYDPQIDMDGNPYFIIWGDEVKVVKTIEEVYAYCMDLGIIWELLPEGDSDE